MNIVIFTHNLGNWLMHRMVSIRGRLGLAFIGNLTKVTKLQELDTEIALKHCSEPPPDNRIRRILARCRKHRRTLESKSAAEKKSDNNSAE